MNNFYTIYFNSTVPNKKVIRVKKRPLLKKSIGLILTGWALKYGAMSLHGNNWESPQADSSQKTQSFKTLSLDQNIANDT